MSDDFRDLNLDKLTRRELKTPEQIAKHTVEGYLETRVVDRALHLLTVGDELQKISVMKNLPMLIKEDLTACIQRIVPRMQQTLPHGSTEYNMGACDAVRTVARQNLMSTDNFTKVFLQHILNSLESRDTVAADEWLNVLLDIIKVLPTNVLHSEVLPIAVNKAHISKPVHVRVTSCRILGHLALSFSAVQVKRDIIPVVISLCQDVSGEVRAAISKELPNLASTLGMETSNFLLNHLLDLVSDEEAMVREAAVEAVAYMLPKFHSDTLKSTIIPLTKKVFPEIVKNEDGLLVVLTKVYGHYAIGLKNYMTVTEKSQFLQRYIQMSQLNSNNRRNKINPYNPIVMDEDELALRLTDCRLNCAYNFPAMVMFAQDLKQELIDALISVMRNLASDSFCQVRKKIASGFYEVMKLMPKWQAALKAEFIRLLKDDIDIVQEGLVPNVSDILLSLSSSNTLTSDKVESGKDVGQALFVCEKNLNDAPHWRLQEGLLSGFRVVPKVFHPEFVYLYFVPLLLTRAVSGRILPCRVAALNTLLVIIADPSQAKQKLKIRNKVLELCNNSSFHCRQLFLRGMSTFIVHSPEVLKELFFHNITSMAEDKVPNIRLMLCKLLPKLKTIALDPVDRKLLASIDAAITSMSGETDRDVQMQLKIALNLMDEGDKVKSLGSKRLEPDVESSSAPRRSIIGFSNTISPLTDMRSFTSESSARSISSQYSMASQQQQTLSSRPKPYTGSQSIRAQSMPATTTGTPRNHVTSRITTQKPGIKAPVEKRKTSLPRR
uniref:Condensin complex subunit 1 C-terminal domain-containing protein n=2 Tax=Cuerna arida TaxID=1464854 RepID=A0A1B6GR04_9HEMI